MDRRHNPTVLIEILGSVPLVTDERRCPYHLLTVSVWHTFLFILHNTQVREGGYMAPLRH